MTSKDHRVLCYRVDEERKPALHVGLRVVPFGHYPRVGHVHRFMEEVPDRVECFPLRDHLQYLVPGAFTISGTGGANIGKFTADLTIPSFPTLTSPSNLSSITRSSGLTVTWAGGGPGANVEIQLYGTPGNTGLTGSQIVCEAPSSVGKFTIPAYVLAALPTGNVGYFSFTPYVPEAPFTATGLVTGEIQTYGPGPSFGPFTLK